MTQVGAVRAVLAEVAQRSAETLTADQRLADLGLDSLGRLMLAVLLEERTGQPLSDEVLLRVVTVEDLERALQPAGLPA
jgi:acyl carrier protein